MNRLRQISEILVDVSKMYETIVSKRESAGWSEKKKIDENIKKVKGQILYLLTAIEKLTEQENV